MTNIWTDSFKDLREPFFNIEDPYTLTEGKKESEKEDDDEDDAGEDEEHKYKKTGKKSKDYDGDGEVEDEADEYAGVKDRAIKKAMRKEEVEPGKVRKNKKIDVGNVENKINTKPSIEEEQKWIKGAIKRPGAFTKKAKEHDMGTQEFASYVDKHPEKFDTRTKKQANLAQTLKGMREDVELDEANSTAIPPKGDAETVTVDSSAKRRAAQMQVKKELADVQLAKAKAQSGSTNESVILYLENRYNING
jgi:hypothetical protein